MQGAVGVDDEYRKTALRMADGPPVHALPSTVVDDGALTAESKSLVAAGICYAMTRFARRSSLIELSFVETLAVM